MHRPIFNPILAELHKILIKIKMACNIDYKPFFNGAPSGTRTLDPLIKSQLLYQLS